MFSEFGTNRLTKKRLAGRFFLRIDISKTLPHLGVLNISMEKEDFSGDLAV